MREIFGSIAGGAAYKFGLFFHKKTQSWTCGSPAKPVKLTENEAIQKAEEIRNDLVAGAEIISSFGPLNSTADYEQLYKQLEHISGINTVWRMKYYQMLFPILYTIGCITFSKSNTKRDSFYTHGTNRTIFKKM